MTPDPLRNTDQAATAAARTARGRAHDRREQIVTTVGSRSHMEVADLALELRVPVATLRRDLRFLEAQGRVRRSYGRILAVPSSRSESELATRTREATPAQLRVARAAIQEIRDAQTVYLDEGHHAALISRELPTDRRLTIVSPSLPIALQVAQENQHEVVMVGGRVRRRTLGVVEHWAQQMLAELTVDLAFMGANGVSVEHGLTTPDPAVAAVKHAAVVASSRRVFVGDHTKFGVNAFVRFAELSDIDVFVTDTRLPARYEQMMTARGAAIRLA